LGNTGLRVSILGLGTAPFGGVYGAVEEKECKACLDRAIDLGINFIDSAPVYGDTKAEHVLGNCLKGVPRDRYILATKVGCYGSQPLEFDFSAKRVTESVDESLGRLGIDHIDLIQCHDIESADLDQIVNETVPALRECVRRGKARYVGITGLPLNIFRYVTARTDVDTILSYCHYTLCDQSLLDLVPMLNARKIGIINAAPLCMGLLTYQGIPPQHPAPEPLRSACRRAAERCRAMGIDLPQLALHFSLAQREIHTTLVGAASAEVISRNAGWIDAPVDEALFAEVRAILAPVQGVTWATGRKENR
jgi:L-galactose dehydrogenase